MLWACCSEVRGINQLPKTTTLSTAFDLKALKANEEARVSQERSLLTPMGVTEASRNNRNYIHQWLVFPVGVTISSCPKSFMVTLRLFIFSGVLCLMALGILADEFFPPPPSSLVCL